MGEVLLNGICGARSKQILVVHARPGVEQFVSSAQQGQAGMRKETVQTGMRLFFQYGQIFGRSRIVVACQHEFLPDHDAVSVAQGIKGVFAQSGSAPHAEYVHVGLVCQTDQRLIDGFGIVAPEQFGIHEIGPFGGNRTAVEFDGNRGVVPPFRKQGGFRAVPEEPDGAESDLPAPAVFP